MKDKMENKTINNKKSKEKQWRNLAAGAAFFSAFVTLMVTFVGAFKFNYYNLIDVGIFIGLGFGILKGSRICAIVLLAYHLLNRIDMYNRTGDIGTSFNVFSVIFIVIYVLGIMGVFQYHKMKSLAEEPNQ